MESELSRKLLPGEFDGKNVASSNARSDLSYNYQQYGSSAPQNHYLSHSSQSQQYQSPPSQQYYNNQPNHRYPPISQPSQHHLPPLSLPSLNHQTHPPLYNQQGHPQGMPSTSQLHQQPRFQYLPPLNQQHLPSPLQTHTPPLSLQGPPQQIPVRPRQYSNPNPNLPPFNSSNAGPSASGYNYLQSQHSQQHSLHQPSPYYDQNRYPLPPNGQHHQVNQQRGRAQSNQSYNHLPHPFPSSYGYDLPPPAIHSHSNNNSPSLISRPISIPKPSMLIPPLAKVIPKPIPHVKSRPPKKRGKKMKFEDSDDSDESPVELDQEDDVNQESNEGNEGRVADIKVGRIGQRRSDRARKSVFTGEQADINVEADSDGEGEEDYDQEEEEEEDVEEDEDKDPSFTLGQENQPETVNSKRKRSSMSSNQDRQQPQVQYNPSPLVYQTIYEPRNYLSHDMLPSLPALLPQMNGNYHIPRKTTHLDLHTNPNSAVVAANNKKDQEKRFTCPSPGCGRAFARNFNLQSHIKSHSGVREFDCPECTKKFSRKHDCARHCISVHKWAKDGSGPVDPTQAPPNLSSSDSYS